jgi:hypothetical protein
VTGSEQCDKGPMNSAAAYGPGQCTDQCKNAPFCGDGKLDATREECDKGAANKANAYGMGLCTTECKNAGFCGDNIRNGPEACDNGKSGATDLGQCNPECTGFYDKKFIKQTQQFYSTNLGGISGADAKCAAEFGSTYKALIVGGGRRASSTPLTGAGAQDWVVHKYVHYFNARDQLVWRTDEIPLLGVRNGSRMNLFADACDTSTGNYPWSGWANDWTTLPDDATMFKGTCGGWTLVAATGYGSFAFADLKDAASEPCGASSFILCIEQ